MGRGSLTASQQVGSRTGDDQRGPLQITGAGWSVEREVVVGRQAGSRGREVWW